MATLLIAAEAENGPRNYRIRVPKLRQECSLILWTVSPSDGRIALGPGLGLVICAGLDYGFSFIGGGIIKKYERSSMHNVTKRESECDGMW